MCRHITQSDLNLHIPIDKSVFDVVAGGVDEDTTLIPGAALHTDVLMDGAQVLQLAVTHSNSWQHRHMHTSSETQASGVTDII